MLPLFDHKGRRKLSYDRAIVELTRRCNLACAHCIRGEPENVDLSFNDIDEFLEQTNSIYELIPTGGEPTLALPQLEYLLEGIKKRGILLYTLQITINGYIKSPELIQIIKNYNDYAETTWKIAELRNLGLKRPELPINVYVSADPYHVGYDLTDSYYWYKVQLYKIAKVDRQYNGNIPTAKGRAKNLAEAITSRKMYQKFLGMNRKIDLSYDVASSHCPRKSEFKYICPGQLFVACPVALVATGDICADYAINYPYSECGEWKITNGLSNIYEDFLTFNRRKNTYYCEQCAHIAENSFHKEKECFEKDYYKYLRNDDKKEILAEVMAKQWRWNG